MGAVISQAKQPIAFYSRKLNSAQRNYTTTERELLSIVETLKEFCNILLGQQIVVFTDHKNLTYANFNTACVMRWRLILEEYNPTLKYVKGVNNVVADALSRLPADTTITQTMFPLEEDDLPEEAFPLTYKNISKCQKQDKELLKKMMMSS